MEKIDLYDNNRIKTGIIINRGESVPNNLNRLVVHVCIFNDDNKLLIQKRSAIKSHWPLLWDVSCGGQVISGETSNEAIERELKEELGIDIDFSNIRPNFTFNFNNGFDDFYIINKNIDLSKCVLQEEEVECVKWATLEEIKEHLVNNEFVKYVDYFFDYLFQVKNSPDNIYNE